MKHYLLLFAFVASLTSVRSQCTVDTVLNVQYCQGATYYFQAAAYAGQNPNITAPGTYTDTLFGYAVGGCDSVVTLNITFNLGYPISIRDSIVNINTCNPMAGGELYAFPSGGVAPYSYLWGQFNQIQWVGPRLINLPVAPYFVIVSDVHGCADTLHMNIINTADSMRLAVFNTNLWCGHPKDTTTITVSSDAYTRFIYKWGDGTVDTNFTSPASHVYGSESAYTITVTDTAGCSITVTDSIRNLVPGCVILNAGNDTSICSGASVTLGGNPTAAGGTPPYTYQWSPATGLSSSTSANPLASPMITTTFTVVVTDSLGDTASSHITVYVNSTPLLDSFYTSTQSCSQDTIGTICAYTTGGSTPFHFAWTNSQNTPCINGLLSGYYGCTVTDNFGCASTLADTLKRAPGTSPVLDSFSHTIVTCAGLTQLCAFVSGGAPPYSYTWTGYGDTTSCMLLTAPGIFVVTFIDNNHCSTSGSFNDSINSGVQLTSVNITPDSCTGTGKGSACFNTAGGPLPHHYQWNDGSSDTSTCITQLTSGYYSVTVTDAWQCSATGTLFVPTMNGLTLSDSIINATCSGVANGSIIITASQGIPPYYYSIDNGITYQSLNTYTGLAGGSYPAIVKDSLGCTASANPLVDYNGLSPEINISAPASTVCNGSNIQLYGSAQASCGIAAIPGSSSSYQPAGGNTAQGGPAFVFPGLLSNLSNSTRNQMLYKASELNSILYGSSAPSAGATLSSISFYLSVFNSTAFLNNLTIKISCTSADSLTAWQANLHTVYTAANYQPVAGWNKFNFTTGYNWDGVSNIVVELCNWNPNTYGNQNNKALCLNTGYTSYIYQYAGHGPNGPDICGLDTSFIQTSLRPNIQFSAGAPVTNTYSYGWSPSTGSGAVSNASIINPTATLTQNTTYYLTASDTAGCTATDSITITVNGNTAPVIDSFVTKNLICPYDSLGSICMYVSGGATPYTYAWSNGSTQIPCINNLAAGVYIATLTDNIGCFTTGTDTVKTSGSLVIDSVVTTAACFGFTNGTACAFASIDTVQYLYYYMWYNGDTARCQYYLAAGTYTVTFADFYGCSGTKSFSITQGTQLRDSIISINPTCFNACNGYLNAVAYGGTPPYSYSWSNSVVQPQTSACSGPYYVIIVDANFCSISDNDTLSSTNQMQLNVTATDSGLHFGGTDTLTAVASGGTPPYGYYWEDTLPNNPKLIVDQCGNYNVIVTDSNLCSVELNYSVTGCSFDSVWPGDANYDGIVNNADLLPIGVAYGDTGFARQSPTINWVGQYCQNWQQFQVDSANYKHIDCDGNGTINYSDTDAIVLNYSQTHTRGSGDQIWRSNVPALKMAFDYDTLSDGQTVIVTLLLGDSLNIASHVYGLAFAFNYDPIPVDSNGVSMVFDSSWLYGNGDHMALAKNFYSPGRIEAALTRINHHPRTGQGPICKVNMKITTGNINGKNLAYYNFKCYISDLIVIDSAGNQMPTNEGSDSAQVGYYPTGITETDFTAGGVYIFPNPVTNKLNITSRLQDISRWEITDMLGHLIMQQEVNTVVSAVDVGSLAAGTYLLNVTTGNRQLHGRFVKIGK